MSMQVIKCYIINKTSFGGNCATRYDKTIYGYKHGQNTRLYEMNTSFVWNSFFGSSLTRIPWFSLS